MFDTDLKFVQFDNDNASNGLKCHISSPLLIFTSPIYVYISAQLSDYISALMLNGAATSQFHRSLLMFLETVEKCMSPSESALSN